MAQYLGEVQGSRGPVSRLGSKSSGLSTTCNGWDSGVYVSAHYNKQTGRDEFTITLNGGSNGSLQGRLLGTFARIGDKMVEV